MTPSPSMLPVSGEQHEVAVQKAIAAFFAGRDDTLYAVLDAYFASLAAQGVRLVDASGDRLVTLTVCARSGQLPHECGLVACDNGCETEDLEFVRVDGSAVEGVRLADRDVFVREVVEWLREAKLPGRGFNVGNEMADAFLARFGGGDER